MTETAAPVPGTPAAPPPGAAPTTPPAPPPAGTPPAPTAFQTPWTNAQGVYMIGEGDAAKPWYEGIEEQPIKDYMKEKNYANPYEAARAAWNANKLNKITPDVEAVLSGKATPEQEANFYKQMGRPDTPEAYKFAPEAGVEVDPSLMQFGKNLFHKMGLNEAKATEAFKQWQEFAVKSNAAITEQQRVQNDTDLAALKTTWGPDLEANRAAGSRAVAALGIKPDLIERVEKHIGSAAIVELLAAIGKKSAEGTFQGGGVQTDPNDPNTMTKEAAQARIAQLQNDQAFQKKYTDKNDPGHKDAVDHMQKLFAKTS